MGAENSAERKEKMKNAKELQEDVIEELHWEPSVKAAAIGVSAEDGVITLTGSVDSYSEKLAARNAASRVFGVTAVADELKVRLPDYNRRTDEDIARSAANAIAWNAKIPADCVKAVVEDGWVTLEGEVNWQYERNAAEEAVHHLRGVLGVSNEIAVKPLVQKLEVAGKIESALARNARLDAERIKVELKGSKIFLRGTVHSFAERDEAERAVWSTPGVSEVENQLKVRFD
jgi:osmotically-inducible protein OsmY